MSLIVAQIASFIVYTAGVGVLTWLIVTRGSMAKSASASDEYFAGGHSLPWYVVAGSLMLTNLSTEQLVGLNGAIFKDGCLGGTAWETFAALAMCVTAGVFLPVFMRFGLTTTTGFLGKRFDLTTRTIVSTLFLIFYAVGLCPSVLYTGALGVMNIFHLDMPLWVVSTGIGIVGAIYAIFGGLKAVAVSDCLNGLGLIIVGLWVPIAALQAIGGLSGLFSEPSFLRPLVSESEVFDDDTGLRNVDVPSVPWHVTITGLSLQNLYYWSTNQLIVQRALAARSLADGQKGVLFAAFMKVVGFLMLCLPGIIGAIIVKTGIPVNGEPLAITKSDTVYPLLVRAVMPDWSLGFFAAVLLGSILSTFNSALNSASTLFGLEIYKIYIRPDASDERTVKVASIFGIVLSLVSFAIAPQLEHVETIFDFLQRAKTVASLPIVTCFIVGIATVTPDAFSAKFGFTIGMTAYIAGQFLEEPHFLHIFFCCFILALASMFLAAYSERLRRCFCQPPVVPFKDSLSAVAEATGWRFVRPVIGVVVFLVVFLTVSLQIGNLPMFVVFSVLWSLCMVAFMALPTPRSPRDAGQDKPEGAATFAEAATKEATFEDDITPNSPLRALEKTTAEAAAAKGAEKDAALAGNGETWRVEVVTEDSAVAKEAAMDDISVNVDGSDSLASCRSGSAKPVTPKAVKVTEETTTWVRRHPPAGACWLAWLSCAQAK